MTYNPEHDEVPAASKALPQQAPVSLMTKCLHDFIVKPAKLGQTSSRKILLIANEGEFGLLLAQLLKREGLEVSLLDPHRRLDPVLRELSRNAYDMVLPTNNALRLYDIKQLVPEIKQRLPQARIVVLSGYTPTGFVRELKWQGIDDFFQLPFSVHEFIPRIRRLLSS